ncbi:translation initiation factor IF-3, mitochondrial [Sphaeramia orbicularis]|uniref:Mitochondrial translational initiation factor 3 n=1 Tax=Sphaeramia orbicularis TaxID=375764 RepID=A0A673CWV5_9TELE|nr:translation initiation factor IF-3, mitochondrial [Sphaeramia orbicularis]
MSAFCVRWLLTHAVRTVNIGVPSYVTAASRFTVCSQRCHILTASWRRSPFCTAVDDTGQTEETTAPKKKKQNPRGTATIGSVGRKIPHRLVQLISETEEDLGTMHRVDVIKIMDEQGLKLVLLNEHKDPPVYRLMSGKQIHEEQLKLREKQKKKPTVVQVKELTFSVNITAHDLTTKLKQVENWLEKKHHVRITLRSGRREPVANLDTTLENLLQQIEVQVGFVAKPQVTRDGQAAKCTLRPPSAKELSQKAKKQTSESGSEATLSNTSPPSTRDSAGGSVQQ